MGYGIATVTQPEPEGGALGKCRKTAAAEGSGRYNGDILDLELNVEVLHFEGMVADKVSPLLNIAAH